MTDSSVDANSDTDGDTGTSGPRCPSHLEFTTVGANTHSDLGWAGFGHNLRVNDESVFTLEVVSCDDECINCAVQGPVPNESGPNIQRCIDDTRIECTGDADCPGGGKCRFITGPPLSLDTPGRPACSIVYLEAPEGGDWAIEGSVNLQSGEVFFDVARFRSTSNPMPDGSPRGTCMVCQNDPTPNDGVQGGTCQAGGGPLQDVSAWEGEPCDGNGFGALIGGTYSFDCPPTLQVPSLDFDLRDYTTLGETWTMTDTRPDCTNPMLPAGTPCWCGICDGTSDPCEADTDCAAGVSCGYLPTDEGTVPTAPSGCMTPCIWDPVTARGSCESAAIMGLTVGCFPSDTMTTPAGGMRIADGEYIATLGAIQCLAASPVLLTNQAFGLPGPALYTNTYRFTTQFR
ncbi:MAG: hypothetical protein AAGF12_18205 [Myxococcota bacterium]